MDYMTSDTNWWKLEIWLQLVRAVAGLGKGTLIWCSEIITRKKKIQQGDLSPVVGTTILKIKQTKEGRQRERERKKEAAAWDGVEQQCGGESSKYLSKYMPIHSLQPHQVLHLLVCFPFHQLRRRLVAFICLLYLSSEDDDDDEDSSDDLSVYACNSHSDWLNGPPALYFLFLFSSG